MPVIGVGRLTWRRLRAILRAASTGCSPLAAAMAVGIPKSTWYSWMAIASGHMTRFADGSPVAPSTVAFLARLGAAIGRAQAKCELRQTGYITSAGAEDWRAAESWLRRSEFSRDRWREERQLKVEQTGSVSYEHRLIQQLPEAEVLELAGPEWAELVQPLPTTLPDAQDEHES